jgi:hypothetical protein
MRTIAAICIASTLISAPAFAQAGKGGEAVSAKPNSLLSSSSPSEAKSSGGLSFGFLDKLTIKNGGERSAALPFAPIEKDQLELAWRPGGKWGITLDLTSRSPNDVLPREELAAGAYYQVTPRFRFGGGVTLNGESLRSAAEGWKQQEGEAGVRIESAFSF